MDASSTPLAEYFWIAGVESVSYDDPLQGSDLPVEAVISEDGEPDDGRTNGYRAPAARHSRQNSANRLSRVSLENRYSISSTLDELEGNSRSNRSSATIKPSRSPNGANANGSNGTSQEGGGPGLMNMPDFDFDNALLKFAAERENFLDDLSFTAGAKLHSRPPMVNPRAERIKADDGVPSGRLSPLRSLKGSIRRRISFREMNSARKQPNPNRQGATSRACTPPSFLFECKHSC